MHLFRRGLSFFFYRFRVNTGDDPRIFGPLHAAFYLYAGDARLFNFSESVNEAAVFKGERIIVHPAA